jgi:hypothetical protein
VGQTDRLIPAIGFLDLKVMYSRYTVLAMLSSTVPTSTIFTQFSPNSCLLSYEIDHASKRMANSQPISSTARSIDVVPHCATSSHRSKGTCLRENRMSTSNKISPLMTFSTLVEEG